TLDSVRRDAPWAWLKAGFADMMASPVISIGYGIAVTVTGLLITAGLWSVGQAAMVPVLAGGFALIAPAFAVGIYRIYHVRESGQTPRLLAFWSLPPGRIGQLALLSVLLL
ncbi:DUF2189 domain-containing protein, partial [Marinicauda pacifica]